MPQSIAMVALLVHDYDEAIAYYTGTLGFELMEDTALNAQKRWVVIRPRNANAGTALLLARANGAQQIEAIGNQAGGRVFLFLETSDFDGDYKRYLEAGVKFMEQPREESYGRVAVFEDLYSNRWDLLERRA